MDRWSQLSMSDKSALMQLYIRNGISSLEEIKKHYNSFANGGLLSQDEGDVDIPNKHWYDNYHTWRRKMSKHKGIDIKHDDDYDYKGFYKENQAKAWGMLDENPEEHFTDLYKYPTHPTFSSQSKYSQQWQQDHNVKNWVDAPVGGDWGTDEQNRPVFYHSYYTASTPEKIQRTAEYLKQNDPGVKAVFEPVIANITLPQVDIIANPELTQQQVRMINGGMYMPKTMQTKIDEINKYYKNLEDINNQSFPDLRKQTYDIFNSQIWDLENQAREGYDKNTDKWVAHKSPEGGAETIGGGIKLNKGNKKWADLYKQQGYLTTTQVEEAMQENAKKAYNAAKNAYSKTYSGKEWEQLNPTLRALLMDISYNTGNVSEFKGLMKAIHNKDVKEIKKQHHRSYKDEKGKTHPVKNRNDYFDSIIVNTPDLFSLGGLLTL